MLFHSVRCFLHYIRFKLCLVVSLLQVLRPLYSVLSSIYSAQMPLYSVLPCSDITSLYSVLTSLYSVVSSIWSSPVFARGRTIWRKSGENPECGSTLATLLIAKWRAFLQLLYLLEYKSTFYDQKSAKKIAFDLYMSHTQRPDKAVQEISITIAWSALGKLRLHNQF